MKKRRIKYVEPIFSKYDILLTKYPYYYYYLSFCFDFDNVLSMIVVEMCFAVIADYVLHILHYT